MYANIIARCIFQLPAYNGCEHLYRALAGGTESSCFPHSLPEIAVKAIISRDYFFMTIISSALCHPLSKLIVYFSLYFM